MSHLTMAYEKESAAEAARRRAREDEVAAAARQAEADREFEALAERFVDEEVSRGHNPVPAARAMARTKGEKLIPANAVF